ncbi:MAG: preprotein translocase subunit YajC [Terracidiphilus sp.]
MRASKGREPEMIGSTSFALWAAAPATGSGGGIFALLPILLFIPLLYLMMIRPQQKRQKQWQEMLTNIKSGDKITTAGGIRGVILSIKDDAIIIRVPPDNLKIEVAKNAIASVITQEDSSKS